MIFDTHAHYDDEAFAADRDELIPSLHAKGVELIMDAATKTADFAKILAMTEKYPFMYAALGIHPEETDGVSEGDFEILRKDLACPKVKAIGEIGLDYKYCSDSKDIQKEILAKQVELAKEYKLPVIIHDRDAHGDCIDVLKACSVKDCGGVFHCYGGSIEMLKTVLSWGMYAGFGGTVTFKNSRRVKEAAAFVPDDRILIETDCPYLSPEPLRGRRNDSGNLVHVIKCLAEIRNTTPEAIEKMTYENGKRLFKI